MCYLAVIIVQLPTIVIQLLYVSDIQILLYQIFILGLINNL